MFASSVSPRIRSSPQGAAPAKEKRPSRFTAWELSSSHARPWGRRRSSAACVEIGASSRCRKWVEGGKRDTQGSEAREATAGGRPTSCPAQSRPV